MTVLIVGGGLFGSVARDLLASRGIACQVIDDGRPLSGSPPAGCLTKPSWLSSLGKARDTALELLSALYGIQRLPLRLGPAKLESILHVAPSAILRGPDIKARVDRIWPDDGRLELDSGEIISGDALLIAAGVWCAELLPSHFGAAGLVGLQGMSQRYRGSFPEARLKVWAPFKQSVAFNIEPGVVWFGDGTSIKPSNWSDKHARRASEHAESVGLNPAELLESRIGVRPYVKGRVGWFERAGRRCWVSTGGAKNGLVLAASQAQQFLQALG